MPYRVEGQGRLVRQTYERYPYPGPSIRKPSRRWRLPPAAWLNAIWQPGSPRFQPRRVLVAGCGTGREAFAFANRLPSAQIVAVDFSPRSIAIARRTQRQLGMGGRLRFVVGDLHDRDLPSITGGEFDFISCHGVLSYVARPERVLRRLVGCLSAEGALYLGVNGLTHHSVRWRDALPGFGLDPAEWPETREARRILTVLDAIAEQTPTPRLARRTAAYLASDVFGPPIRNWPLQSWLALTKEAGLHFRGSHSCVESLKGLCEQNLAHLLIPRSRAAQHELEEQLIPSAFHRFVLTQSAPPNAPWNDARELLNWRPVTLGLHRLRTRRKRPAPGWRRIQLTLKALNLLVEMPLEDWLYDMLRRPLGARALADFLPNSSAQRIRTSSRDTMYTLYLLGVLEMMPPARQA
jgi:SAM-dependent methyltransferase